MLKQSFKQFYNSFYSQYFYSSYFIYVFFYIFVTLKIMKTVSQWKDTDQYHSKCVCETCTCHQHKCPHSNIDLPLGEVSSYQNDFHAHPINTWQKPAPQKPKPYQPYGNISSTYQALHPGSKPQMREKLKPRVKDEDRNIPFDAQSEYRNKFPGKSVKKQPIKIKDRIFTPDNTPFEGGTTYKSSYPKKLPNIHEKKKDVQYSFPEGYKFNGDTTYSNSYIEKPIKLEKNFKPEQRVLPKGTHDLSSIYRDSYAQKPVPEPCPILKMPERPKSLKYPSQHIVYNKNKHYWQQK